MMNREDILQHLGFGSLTTMQEATAVAVERGEDTMLLSPTGSGKTLAFLLPCATSATETLHDGIVTTVIIVPSRELALQTAEVWKAMKTGIPFLPLYGGRPTFEEHRQLKHIKPQLIIATPGRLLDHLDKGNVSFEGVRRVVLDEFDKCLELGFEEDMARILCGLKKKTQLVLTSATPAVEWPAFLTPLGFTEDRFRRIDFLHKDDGDERLTCYTVQSRERDKLDTLRRLLLTFEGAQALVFVAHRESVERVGKYLKESGFPVQTYHGGMPQEQRERNLYTFRAGAATVLVSTDLAARGLDIPDVRHVVHYHLPRTEEDFTHRSGRTARWESEGKAYLILGPEEHLPDYLEGRPTAAYRLSDTEHLRPGRPEWTTIYIGRGKKEKLSKMDVVGFFCKQGGLRGDDIGRIDVMAHHTYVALRSRKAAEALRRIAGEKIKGMKTLIERMRQ